MTGAGDRRRRQPCSEQVVTATGDGNTELSPSGCESSSTDIIRTVDARSSRDSAGDGDRHGDSDPPGGTGATCYVSPVGSRVMQQHDART